MPACKHYTHLSSPVGAAVSLAFAPFHLWPIGIAGLVFLFLAWEHAATPAAVGDAAGECHQRRLGR